MVQIMKKLPSPPHIRKLSLWNSGDLIHPNTISFFLNSGENNFTVDIRTRKCPPLIASNEALLNELKAKWDTGTLPTISCVVHDFEMEHKLPSNSIKVDGSNTSRGS
jgi:hypothetical protein